MRAAGYRIAEGPAGDALDGDRWADRFDHDADTAMTAVNAERVSRAVMLESTARSTLDNMPEVEIREVACESQSQSA